MAMIGILHPWRQLCAGARPHKGRSCGFSRAQSVPRLVRRSSGTRIDRSAPLTRITMPLRFSVSAVCSSRSEGWVSRRGCRLAPLLGFLLLSVLSRRVLSADGFVFAGLSVHTTIEDARKRYLRSSIVGHYVYVSDDDSHDHIHGIELPGDGPDRRLKLFFERSRPRRPEYPRCAAMLAKIKKLYGEPSKVEEFDEEQARNRRFTWWRSDEALSLVCFRFGRQAFSAADLTITMRRDN
jgi:hypothetical protein